VGVRGEQTPVMIIEPWPDQRPNSTAAEKRLLDELFEVAQRHELTGVIGREQFLLHPSLPVDIRHNAKIFREKLVPWAAQRVPRSRSGDKGAESG
jgi:hypothetical protein